jgi:hypothetical protein
MTPHTAESVATLGKRLGWAHMARRTKLSESLLRAIGNGSRPISPASAAALATIAQDAPAAPRSTSGPSPLRPARPERSAEVVPSVDPAADERQADEDDGAPSAADGTSIVHQQRILDFALDNIEAARDDGGVKWSERAALATSATMAIRSLARLRGEAELGEGQILRSKAFARVMVAVEGALAPFGAEPLKAVATALRGIGGVS